MPPKKRVPPKKRGTRSTDNGLSRKRRRYSSPPPQRRGETLSAYYQRISTPLSPPPPPLQDEEDLELPEGPVTPPPLRDSDSSSDSPPPPPLDSDPDDDDDDDRGVTEDDVWYTISQDDVDPFFRSQGRDSELFNDLVNYLRRLPPSAYLSRIRYFARLTWIKNTVFNVENPYIPPYNKSPAAGYKRYILDHLSRSRLTLEHYMVRRMGAHIYSYVFTDRVIGMAAPLFFLLQLILLTIRHEATAMRRPRRAFQVRIQIRGEIEGRTSTPPEKVISYFSDDRLMDASSSMHIVEIEDALREMVLGIDARDGTSTIARGSGDIDAADPIRLKEMILTFSNAQRSDRVGAESVCASACPLIYAAKRNTFIDIDTRGKCFYYAVLVGVAHLETEKIIKKKRKLNEYARTHPALSWVQPRTNVRFDEIEEYTMLIARQIRFRFVLHVFIMREQENRYIGQTLVISERDTTKPKVNICIFAHKDEPLWHAVYCTNEYAITSLEFDDIAQMPRYTVCPRCRKIYNSQYCSGAKKHKCAVDVVNERWWCAKCRTVFRTEDDYNYHISGNCFLKDVARPRIIQLPEAGEICEFNGDKHEVMVPDEEIIFADFESTIDGITGAHTPMSVGYTSPRTGEVVIHHGKDCVARFLDAMMRAVRSKLYIFFHNAMGYDSHFIFTEALKKDRKLFVQGINKSNQQFLSITLNQWVTRGGSKVKLEVTILDTLQFMPMGLAKLTACALQSDRPLTEVFPTWCAMVHPHIQGEEALRAACKKHLYPYYYFNTDEEEYERQMDADIEDFAQIFTAGSRHFSKDVSVEQEKCDEAVAFMHKYPSLFTTARDYHDFYLRCDVAQLRDMFMTVRAHYRRTHDLELVSFFGLPGATWGSFMYKYGNEARLPLLSDPTMVALTRKMIRGGVCSAVKRLACTDDTHTLIYLDANSLYPHVMKEAFPCGEFEFVATPYVHNILEWMDYELERQGKGAIFEVDLAYPTELGEYTKDYPFCPEHIETTRVDYLGSYVEHLLKEHMLERKMQFKGLGQTIRNKYNYAIYWKNLRWYLEHGMVLTKIHRVMRFDEKPYMRDYVEMNTRLRMEGDSEFEKVFYKLLGNALYGKTFENKAKQSKVKIVQSKGVLAKLERSNNIERLLYIAGDALVYSIYNDVVKLDKPSYIGAVVTELSKLHMYKFLYDVLYPRFGRENVQLCYTDTDSFVLEFTHEPGAGGIPAITAQIEDYMALGERSGQTGFFKSETGVTPIKEFVCLRAKVYSMLLENDEEITRAKGVNRAVHSQLTHELYRGMVLGTRSPIFETSMRNIRSRNHTVADERIVKVALSADDMKRIICEDGIHTRPFN